MDGSTPTNCSCGGGTEDLHYKPDVEGSDINVIFPDFQFTHTLCHFSCKPERISLRYKVSNYYWWTASIKPRLLFSRAGYASWGLSLSSVYDFIPLVFSGFHDQSRKCLLNPMYRCKLFVGIAYFIDLKRLEHDTSKS